MERSKFAAVTGFRGSTRILIMGFRARPWRALAHFSARADGVLTLTANGKSVCVVPSNLKFERSVELTPAAAAEQAMIRGTPVSSSPRDAMIPAFKPGVQLVFIAAPDVELADFLRAQRANTVKRLGGFLNALSVFRTPSIRSKCHRGISSAGSRSCFCAVSKFERSQNTRPRHAAASELGGTNRQPVVSRLQTRCAVNGRHRARIGQPGAT